MFVASSVPITMDEDQVSSAVQYTPGIIGADIGVIDTGDDESSTEASGALPISTRQPSAYQ